jgi:hypothetical protein
MFNLKNFLSLATQIKMEANAVHARNLNLFIL